MLIFLGISGTLFLIGIMGMFVLRKNIILLFLCIELMLLAINLNFIIFSVYLDDIMGQIMGIFVLTVAAAEAGIGLAILVVYYRVSGGLLVTSIPKLKG